MPTGVRMTPWSRARASVIRHRMKNERTTLRQLRKSRVLLMFFLSFSFGCPVLLRAQGGHPTPSPKPPGVREIKCRGRTVPQLEDVSQKAGIHFEHLLAPEQKYILESMSGGVLLLDYDRDSWLDIYFTNAPTLEMA